MSSRPKPKPRTRSIRNGINLTDQPIPRGYRRPGRRPHVPSSKPTMSKSRRASSPGSIGSGHRLYRLRRGTKRTRDPLPGRVRCWRGHIWVAPAPVNRLFCNIVAVRRPTGSKHRFGCSSPRLLDRVGEASFKAGKSLELQGYSGALDIAAHRFGFGLDTLHAMLDEVADRHDPADFACLDHRQMADP